MGGLDKHMAEKTTTIEVTAIERTILDIALNRHKEELDKVLKKAKYLGVEVSKATKADMDVLETLKNKLVGQEKLIK